MRLTIEYAYSQELLYKSLKHNNDYMKGINMLKNIIRIYINTIV